VGETLFDRALPTFLENWPKGWAELAPAQVSTALTLDEARALGAAQSVWGSWFGPLNREALAPLREKLKGLFGQLPSGGFVRLGSRSPKDADLALVNGLKTPDAASAFRMLTDGSKRLAWDLREACARSYEPHLFLRAWVDFQDWREIRLFVLDEELVGASGLPDLDFDEPPSESSCRDLAEMAKRLVAAAHIKSFVADVVPVPGDGWVLLDVNPFHHYTDPGLFSWTPHLRPPGDFDGSFRFRVDGRTVALPLRA